MSRSARPDKNSHLVFRRRLCVPAYLCRIADRFGTRRVHELIRGTVCVAFVGREVLMLLAGVLVVLSRTTFAASIGARAITVMAVLLINPHTLLIVIHSKIGKGRIFLFFYAH